MNFDESFCELFPFVVSVYYSYADLPRKRDEAEVWLYTHQQSLGSRVSRIDPHQGVTILYGLSDDHRAFEFKMRFG